MDRTDPGIPSHLQTDRNGGRPATTSQKAVLAQKGLVVQCVHSGERVKMLLGGELDAYSSHLLEGRMRHCEMEGCTEITLDLDAVTFVDSSGLRTLIEAAKRARTGNWRMRVVNARDTVRKVFDMTDMDSLIAYCQANPLAPER
ncbi:MAG: STAS domain-containing protein [Actinomycetota bacterium]